MLLNFHWDRFGANLHWADFNWDRFCKRGDSIVFVNENFLIIFLY